MILSVSIIKEAREEEKVKNNWGVEDSNPASGDKVKKNKKSKIRRMKE